MQDVVARPEPYVTGEPRKTTLRQSRAAARNGAEPQPQGLYRHHNGWSGRHRRGHAATARGAMGYALGDAEDAARLWRRRTTEPLAGPRDHEKARLRTGPSPPDQDVGA